MAAGRAAGKNGEPRRHASDPSPSTRPEARPPQVHAVAAAVYDSCDARLMTSNAAGCSKPPVAVRCTASDSRVSRQ